MLNIEAQLTGLTKIDIRTALSMDYKGLPVSVISCRVVAHNPITRGISLVEVIRGVPLLKSSVLFNEGTFVSYGERRHLNHPIVLKINGKKDNTWYDDNTPCEIDIDIYYMDGHDSAEVVGYLTSFNNYINGLFKVVET